MIAAELIGAAEAEGFVGRLGGTEVNSERRGPAHPRLAGTGHGDRDLAGALEGEAVAAHGAERQELDRLAIDGEVPLPDGEVAADAAVVERGGRLRRRPPCQSRG